MNLVIQTPGRGSVALPYPPPPPPLPASSRSPNPSRKRKNDETEVPIPRHAPTGAAAAADDPKPHLVHLKAPARGAWNHVFSEVTDFHQREYEVEQRQRIIRTRSSVAFDQGTQSQDDVWEEGYHKYLCIQNTLNSYGYMRSKNQKLIHAAYLRSIAHKIWGPRWESCRVRIMKLMNATRLHRRVNAIGPRRIGKSFLVMMMIVAVLVHLPGIEIALFAPGKRAAEDDKEIGMNFLQRIGMLDRVIKASSERLYLGPPGTSSTGHVGFLSSTSQSLGAQIMEFRRRKNKELDQAIQVSKLKIFPSGEKGGRGYTAEISVMEEAAYIEEEYAQKVIFPNVLGMEGNVLWGITTPSDEFNFQSWMIDLKDHNDVPIFETIMVGMPCKDCIEKDQAAHCLHNMSELEPWKSVENYLALQKLQERKAATFAREAQAMIMSDRNYIFQPLHINALAERMNTPYEFKLPVDVLHIAIDPSGGGTYSEYLIMTLAYEEGWSVVRIFL